MATKLLILGTIVAAATAASPIKAEPIATTRVVSCDAGDCLLIRGHRASPQSIIQINDRVVEVAGDRSWRVKVPMDEFRNWSPPFARTLKVTLVDPAAAGTRSDTVRLPPGLLSQNLELASLIVHPR